MDGQPLRYPLIMGGKKGAKGGRGGGGGDAKGGSADKELQELASLCGFGSSAILKVGLCILLPSLPN